MDENLTRGYCQLRSPKAQKKVAAGRGERATPPPRDPCSCIYLGLVLAGAGFLLPYNSFITAVDYYQSRFPGTTIIFDMSMTYIIVAFVSVCINNALIETLSLPVRITFGYILSFAMLLVVSLCDVWYQIFSPHAAYWVTLAAVAVVAVGSTVQQSSFYGFTSMLPMRYTQAVMTGESAAGLLISTNRIVTKALLQDEKVNTMIFFCVSLGLLWACFLIFHITRRTDFARFYIALCESAKLSEDQRGITKGNAYTEEVDFQEAGTGQHYGVLVIQSPTSPSDPSRHFPHPQVPPTPDTTPQPTLQDITRVNEAEVTFQGQNYKMHIPKVSAFKKGLEMRYEVARTVWPYMLSIGLAYFVTLCLFPGIESEVTSCRVGSWMPILMMAVFNLFDFFGKVLAAVHYDWPRGRLVALTVCRVALVPLLMLCATPRIAPTLPGDGWPIVLSLALGLTNGYFGSVPMILAPSRVSEEQRELCGNIMTLSYSVGLTTGSGMAYLLDIWLGPHLSVDPCSLNSTLIHSANFTLG